MTSLEGMSLEGTKVSDASLRHLSGLHNLRWLNLEFTDVTDDELMHLKGLTNLESLRLSYWPSESEGRFTELQRALPDLRIENGLFIHRSFWPPRNHSPRFFASGALLMTGAVAVWLLGLAWMLPLAVVKLSAWFTSRRGDHADTRAPSQAFGALSVRLTRVLWFSRAVGLLLVATAAFLVAMPIVRQLMAVHAVERLGGSFRNRVQYSEGETHSAFSGLGQLDRLMSVQELSFFRSRNADPDLAHLKRLPTLQMLWLNDAPISDAALVHIRGLVDLRELHLRNTRVTDAGLPSLKRFGRLTELDLRDTPITDAGIVHLAELVSLKDLRLSNTAVTDVGVSALRRLTALTSLDLEGTGVTDAGLLHLAKLTELQHLRLTDMPLLTEKGIEHLKELKHLESLSLDGKQLTQAGVESLQQLINLKSLSLKNAQLSEADITDLKRVLPEVYVYCEE
jgi:Leucine-rich repeat (LRR) protein